MTIPDFQTIMLPALKQIADGRELSRKDIINKLAIYFHLSDEELSVLLPSGRHHKFNNRVGWSITYLKKAQLITSSKRGFFKITQRGLDTLKENPPIVDRKYLERFPEFLEFRYNKDNGHSEVDVDNEKTPDELMLDGYNKIKAALIEELTDHINKCSPKFFEKLVVELLLNMGYGGSREDWATITGKAGDGGVDGVIKQDKLGLDSIYIQAKHRNEKGTVGRPDVQSFVGALHGKGVTKGVFITSSKFSNEAIEYAKGIPTPKIILIDGEELANYMIENDLGVSLETIYKIKRIDNDYFLED